MECGLLDGMQWFVMHFLFVLYKLKKKTYFSRMEHQVLALESFIDFYDFYVVQSARVLDTPQYLGLV